MNRLGILILSVLEKSEANSKASAMTVNELSETEAFGYKPNTFFKKCTELESEGYIAQGYKEGRAKTFYITDKGKEFLKNEWKRG